jgi:hypothetical protein
MFKNSDNDNDIEVGHMRSGRVFEKFTLQTYLRRTTGRRVSTVEKRQN